MYILQHRNQQEQQHNLRKELHDGADPAEYSPPDQAVHGGIADVVADLPA
jgi:hypothetical protein